MYFFRTITKMKYVPYFVLILSTIIIECACMNSTDQCPNIKTSLGAIRKRRHLTFPDGSDVVDKLKLPWILIIETNAGSQETCISFMKSLTISLVKAFMTHAPSGWNIALEIDVIFPLPDAKFTNAHFRKKLHHRQKREFWERLQNAIDYHNLNGRACVLRSICEAKSHLAPPGKSLVHDLLRAIFTAPVHEEDFTNEVADTFSELLDPSFCDQTNDCPFSLLHFTLSMNKQKF